MGGIKENTLPTSTNPLVTDYMRMIINGVSKRVRTLYLVTLLESIFQPKILKSDGNSVVVGAWVLVGDYYTANIYNANITGSTRVVATVTKETESIYASAGAVSENNSYLGYVTVYAETVPSDTVIFDLKIETIE